MATIRNEEEALARAKKRLQLAIEGTFVETEKETASRLKFVGMLLVNRDPDMLEALRLVLTRLADAPTPEEREMGADQDAREALGLLDELG